MNVTVNVNVNVVAVADEIGFDLTLVTVAWNGVQGENALYALGVQNIPEAWEAWEVLFVNVYVVPEIPWWWWWWLPLRFGRID